MLEIEPSPLRAFHCDPAVKAKYIARVEAHRVADNLIRGMTGNKS